jgi:hypothetical protein
MPIHTWPGRHGIRVACTVIETLRSQASRTRCGPFQRIGTGDLWLIRCDGFGDLFVVKCGLSRHQQLTQVSSRQCNLKDCSLIFARARGEPPIVSLDK